MGTIRARDTAARFPREPGVHGITLHGEGGGRRSRTFNDVVQSVFLLHFLVVLAFYVAAGSYNSGLQIS
ncbi:MAG: hypothetical protein HY286_13825 [Planctomycetes bacterium]|nr:hypothetical protein [Planctomycetota bacterium]